jgi:hypothetical protein
MNEMNELEISMEEILSSKRPEPKTEWEKFAYSITDEHRAARIQLHITRNKLEEKIHEHPVMQKLFQQLDTVFGDLQIGMGAWVDDNDGEIISVYDESGPYEEYLGSIRLSQIDKVVEAIENGEGVWTVIKRFMQSRD